MSWRRALFGVLSLPIGVVFMVVTLAGLVISAALTLVLVGLVCFGVTFTLTRSAARIERARARWLIGVDVAKPPRFPPPRRGLIQRVRSRLRDRQTWSEVAYLLLGGPLGVVSALLVILVCFVIAQAVAYPFNALSPGYTDNAWGGPTYLGAVAIHSGAGLVTVFAGPWLIWALTALHGGLVRRLLGPTQ